MDAHIDIEERMRHVSKQRADHTMRQAICAGDPAALAKLQEGGDSKVALGALDKCAREYELKRREAPLGPRQVESLLCFMVSPEIEKALEDAEGDNGVYDALGEHRILGRRKTR